MALGYHVYGSVGAIPKTPAKKILNVLKRHGVDVLGSDNGQEFLQRASNANNIHKGILKFCEKMVEEQRTLRNENTKSNSIKI